MNFRLVFNWLFVFFLMLISCSLIGIFSNLSDSIFLYHFIILSSFYAACFSFYLYKFHLDALWELELATPGENVELVVDFLTSNFMNKNIICILSILICGWIIYPTIGFTYVFTKILYFITVFKVSDLVRIFRKEK